MIPVLLRSTARSGLLLFAVAVLVFAATELLPGDAVQARTRGRAGDAELARLREQAGLDAPAWLRFARWLGGFLHGDAGRSLISDRPVSVLVAERLPATLALTVLALLVAVPLMLLAAWVGSSARLRPPVGGVIAAAAAVPQVVVAGALVALFSGLLHWLPRVSLLPIGQSPWQRPELLVLPALSLALPAAAFGAGLLAGAVGDVRRLPHVEDAVLRGVPRWRVAVRHVFPLLFAPLLRVLAVICGGLVAATTVVETVFGYNGLGELLVSSVASRDVPTVQAVALLGAVVVLAGLWLADVVRGGAP
ncbi:ABC transporter permease [Saccharopolyspora sp. WRP15-2]|uniref:ABC transporter permease n=1 Tax=Saccharopolyspora oryzae TaxID=2997343 RepID=A0ABT4VCZ7_9PSEU|nr:ABC transporter permease [Saccharopolyspora oryzae]MDA3631172.1 ABC transporter permease [Saccharopolyspora oryzae]